MANVTIDQMLKLMTEHGASDLFIAAGAPASIKVHGKLVPITKEALTPERCREVVLSMMNEQQRNDFVQARELNFAISARGVGRYRCSAFYQRNLCGAVLRRIETTIPEVESLGLPPIIKELAMTKRGLIIFVGATGTGKSTSLASMLGHRNRNSSGHIITIEDPIEFLHKHQGCIVTQREVGIDTDSFEVALKNTLRQAPDVILIGEVRTKETMQHALTFAETGHLCLCTLHANNANQALDRILSFFPPEAHHQVFMDLSLNLRAMIAQQLIPTPDGEGRKACIEVLLNTPLASDMIRKGAVHELKGLMTRSTEQGMQTFDQALYKLYEAGDITRKDALAYADSPNDLRLMIKLGVDADLESMEDEADKFTLKEDEPEVKITRRR